MVNPIQYKITLEASSENFISLNLQKQSSGNEANETTNNQPISLNLQKVATKEEQTLLVNGNYYKITPRADTLLDSLKIQEKVLEFFSTGENILLEKEISETIQSKKTTVYSLITDFKISLNNFGLRYNRGDYPSDKICSIVKSVLTIKILEENPTQKSSPGNFIQKFIQKWKGSQQQVSLGDEIKKHKIELLEKLYQEHQSLPVTTENQKLANFDRLQTMLRLALTIQHIPYIYNLIQGGAQLNNDHLAMAIMLDSPELINRFIKEGCNPNGSIGDGSLIGLACSRGQKASNAIKALLGSGASLTISEPENDRSPIGNAIRSDLSSDQTIELLETLQDLNFQNPNKDFLIHDAIWRISSRKDAKILEYLMTKKVNPNVKNAEQKTPLHKAIELLQDRSLPIVDLLLKEGAISTALDVHGQVPLHYAAKLSCQNDTKDDGSLVRVLIQNNPSAVHVVDNEGRTALHEAIRYSIRPNNIKSLEELVKAGADVDAQDSNGNTSLHLAVQGAHLEQVRFLLEHGANRNIRNQEGKLPGAMLFFGSDGQKGEILNLLSKF